MKFDEYKLSDLTKNLDLFTATGLRVNPKIEYELRRKYHKYVL